MTLARDAARDARRFLEEEAAAGRADLWETVISRHLRGDRAPTEAGAAGSAAEVVAPSAAEVTAAGLASAAPGADPELDSLLFDVPVGTAAVGAAAHGPVAPLAGDTLEGIAAEARACVKCGLSGCRTQAVPGVGGGQSGIVFVGEAPGAEEDRRGEPFVGRAGELLTRILAAMDERGLLPGVPVTRDSVYICNVLKCRPPENRNPLPHEIEACSPYLYRQLALLRPRVICCLGKFAAELLAGARGTVGSMRGQVYRFGQAKLLVTYHPAACLRNPNLKRPVWEDMQRLAQEYLAP